MFLRHVSKPSFCLRLFVFTWHTLLCLLLCLRSKGRSEKDLPETQILLFAFVCFHLTQTLVLALVLVPGFVFAWRKVLSLHLCLCSFVTLSLDANSCACAYSVLFSLVLALMLLFVSFRLTQTALVHHTTHASIPLFSLDKLFVLVLLCLRSFVSLDRRKLLCLCFNSFVFTWPKLLCSCCTHDCVRSFLLDFNSVVLFWFVSCFRLPEFESLVESILENSLLNLLTEANRGEVNLTSRTRVIALPPNRTNKSTR